MSIAWATVVLVVLLLPGFCFFWGFYAPHAVTRESVPTSPLSQLAAVVIVSFLVHSAAYVVLNGPIGLCSRAWPAHCIDFDGLAALLRTDGAPTPGRPAPSLNGMLDRQAGWILVYFAVAGAAAYGLGWWAGRLVIKGRLPLARHRYLFMLEEGLRASSANGAAADSAKRTRLIRAHVLSKTSHDDLVLIYDGILSDFFSSVGGTISYVVLRGARCGTVKIAANEPQRAGVAVPLDASAPLNSSTAILFIASDDIANIYFEQLPDLLASEADEQALDAALAEVEADASRAAF